ncbi:hypothetical protein N9K44_01620 [Flavobacteriaceae bacterium]|nr:hypothetical protein [Flavobacteriaceae bacterium]
MLKINQNLISFAVNSKISYSICFLMFIINNLLSQVMPAQFGFSYADQDGNTYDYLTYGDQVWDGRKR